MAEGKRHFHGGIVSLVKFIDEHSEAINYDLLTKIGITLQDVPEKLDWGGLRDFIKFLPPQSALGVDLYPQNKWSQESYLLADVVDCMQGLLWSLGGGKGSRPKPVKRPGQTKGKVLDITTEEFEESWNAVVQMGELTDEQWNSAQLEELNGNERETIS